MICRACPRACGIDRKISAGVCGVGEEFLVARAALHLWEEPPVSGTNGSGAVFFSGCNLHCVFCQNREISTGKAGKPVSGARLEEIFRELIAQGAHNINLVTPSHYTAQLLPHLIPLSVPYVWNSSAYEKTETLRLLEGKVSVFLPDFKFGTAEAAQKYAGAPDYPQAAKAAIMEMFRQTGPVELDSYGLIRRGVILRHLILPGNPENTRAVLSWVAETFREGDILFSLMSQYTPYRTLPFPELNRRLTKREYILARNEMLKLKINRGFVQELSSAMEEYTPAFDGTGV